MLDQEHMDRHPRQLHPSSGALRNHHKDEPPPGLEERQPHCGCCTGHRPTLRVVGRLAAGKRLACGHQLLHSPQWDSSELSRLCGWCGASELLWSRPAWEGGSRSRCCQLHLTSPHPTLCPIPTSPRAGLWLAIFELAYPAVCWCPQGQDWATSLWSMEAKHFLSTEV